MQEKELYIEYEPSSGSLYEQLQRSTRDEIQRLSGEVWTDYNPGDPGITMADILNYALTELDYKLGFDLQDYLIDKKAHFEPQQYGLFLPEMVYPTAPVTVMDYQKLLLSEFPEIEKVEMVPSERTGYYNITLYLSSFGENTSTLCHRVFLFFHRHRNLCENLREEDIKIHEKNTPTNYISLVSEVELDNGADPSSVLAHIYWHIMSYLFGSVRVKRLDRYYRSENIIMEEWVGGKERDTEVLIPEQNNNQEELFIQLSDIRGVKKFKTCFFVEGITTEEAIDSSKKMVSSFCNEHTLFIPRNRSELKVRLYAEGADLSVNMERFHAELQALSLARENRQPKYLRNQQQSYLSQSLLKPGVYREVWDYASIMKDFPECYRTEIERSRLSGSTPCTFEVYLSLFDRLIERGLEEVRQLKELLSIHHKQSNTMWLLKGEGREISEEIAKRNIFLLKNRYMDFLDDLYGVESSSVKVDGVAWYGLTEKEELERRARFLSHVPELTECRFQSYNIYDKRNRENLPVIKKYISLLFGLSMDESMAVGNVLPSHNLMIMSDEERDKRAREMLNFMLVDERMLSSKNIENIPLSEDDLTDDEKQSEYNRMRYELMIFNNNLLSGGLFRGGIDIRHYYLVTVGESEYLLVFRNEEDNDWLTIGRSNHKNRLVKFANLLCRYLQELNRKCEAIYVLEHNLFLPSEHYTDTADESFKVSFVMPNWTSRFHSERFITSLKKVISQLLPAHINYKICQLNVLQMQYFERAYHEWREVLAKRESRAEIIVAQDAMLSELT